jgi:hypothetical protein
MDIRTSEEVIATTLISRNNFDSQGLASEAVTEGSKLGLPSSLILALPVLVTASQTSSAPTRKTHC